MSSEMAIRRPTPAGWADSLVGRIDRHKASMLAFSISTAAVLALVAIFIAFVEGDGGHLTTLVEAIGGYVAIVALVLGLPALGYAMVTDRAVERLRDALGGLTDDELHAISKQIGTHIQRMLHDWDMRLPDGHCLQLFVPNRQRNRLVPIYDPESAGPDAGWEVNPDAPQAITGSAWVEDRYIYATEPDLQQSGLRLTSQQHARYEPLTGVAAAPIRREGEEIGVLVVFTEAEEPKMQDPEFIELHRRLADGLSSIISEHVPKKGALAMKSISGVEEAPRHSSGVLV